MKKLSVLSFCLRTTGYLFRRIPPIIILTFSALVRVSDEDNRTFFKLPQLSEKFDQKKSIF